VPTCGPNGSSGSTEKKKGGAGEVLSIGHRDLGSFQGEHKGIGTTKNQSRCVMGGRGRKELQTKK